MKVSINRYKMCVVYMVIILLPSCGRLTDWVEDSFKQVPLLDTRCGISEKYNKSITLYDQLTTKAKFDVLWLADEVRFLYTELLALKFGKTAEQKKTLLRRQLEENNHFIS